MNRKMAQPTVMLTCDEQEDGADGVHPLRQPGTVVVVVLQHSTQLNQRCSLAQRLGARGAVGQSVINEGA